MIYLTSITNPFLNLAVEEWLFRNSIHEFTLLLYRNAPSIVIGRNQNPWTEVNQSLLRMKRIPLVRRLSGGGTVYHDLGNTNYCVIMPKSKFTRSYSANLVCSALQQLDVPAIVNDRFDITLNGAKISGSAYRLSNNRSYHHGTMLIDTDLDSLSGLILPSRPSGIQGGGIDSVRAPVTRIAKTSYTVDHFTFCQAVQAEFKARFNQAHVTVIGPDVVNHPQSTNWIYGQTPIFTHTVQTDSQKLTLTVEKGVIRTVDSPILEKYLLGKFYHEVPFLKLPLDSDPRVIRIMEELRKVSREW